MTGVTHTGMAASTPHRIEEEAKARVEKLLRPLSREAVKPRYELLWRCMWYVILANRALVEGHPVLRRPFNMPSELVYRHQWLWDSAFHA